ncbi:hypothetical protein NQ315_013493 [Exocentrus adspersus]|uniref:Uncharacterized protein n=1 Tax=Exocentrus adspersus TaxID=1586481 RepID=A0AAV8V8J7_9CUCU|nr:hypothetical protein NQ315_013493 [Exocentrus adspersus]
MVYRHKRVVSGINSSPFVLGATIEHHLKNNCVTSVPDYGTLGHFVREVKLIMQEAQFDLRRWESSAHSRDHNQVSVLGLIWQKGEDSLKISGDLWKECSDLTELTITKRFILSMANRVFDVIEYTCPATLIPKLLLQRIWEKQLPWNKPVDMDIEKEFRLIGRPDLSAANLYSPVDSKKAYSAGVSIWTVRNGDIEVSLLGAKFRITPLRKLTIPRLELLAATIGVRLYASIKDSLDYGYSSFMDLTQGGMEYIFMEQGRRNSKDDDTLSLICRLGAVLPNVFFGSKWWEGPDWLYQDLRCWPQGDLNFDEEKIEKDPRKGNDSDKCIDWLLGCVREPGKDNKVRLVYVDIAKGQLLRPLRRLYPLESVDNSPFEGTQGVLTTEADEFHLQPKPESENNIIGSAAVNHSRVPDNARCDRDSNEPEIKAKVNNSAGVDKTREPIVTRSGRRSKLPYRFHF